MALATALVGLGTHALAQTPDDAVHFVDAALETAVRSHLNQPEGEITTVDMARLTGLYVHGAGITNLTGLQSAFNLTVLALPSNEVENISPLAGLANLTSLSLYRNNVVDISPLAGMTSSPSSTWAGTRPPTSTSSPPSTSCKRSTSPRITSRTSVRWPD